jgi:serine/threonine protein kinase
MEIPPEIDEIIMKCLSKEPQKRFNSINAVEAELYRIYNASHNSSARRKVFDMF